MWVGYLKYSSIGSGDGSCWMLDVGFGLELGDFGETEGFQAK